MLELIKNESFWLLAIGINLFFSFVKPFFKVLAYKISKDNEKMRQQFYWFIILIISFISVKVFHNTGDISLIDNSYILTTIWLAFTSIFIYSVGIDFIFNVIKNKVQK